MAFIFSVFPKNSFFFPQWPAIFLRGWILKLVTPRSYLGNISTIQINYLKIYSRFIFNGNKSLHSATVALVYCWRTDLIFTFTNREFKLKKKIVGCFSNLILDISRGSTYFCFTSSASLVIYQTNVLFQRGL